MVRVPTIGSGSGGEMIGVIAIGPGSLRFESEEAWGKVGKLAELAMRAPGPVGVKLRAVLGFSMMAAVGLEDPSIVIGKRVGLSMGAV